MCKLPAYGRYLIGLFLIGTVGYLLAASAGPPLEYRFLAESSDWTVLNGDAVYEDRLLTLATTQFPPRLEARFDPPIPADRFSLLEIRMAVDDQRVNFEGRVDWSTQMDTSSVEQPDAPSHSFRVPPDSTFQTHYIHLGANWRWTDLVSRLTLTPIDVPGTVRIQSIRLYKATPWNVWVVNWRNVVAQRGPLMNSALLVAFLGVTVLALCQAVRALVLNRLSRHNGPPDRFVQNSFRLVLGLWIFLSLFTVINHYHTVVSGQRQYAGLSLSVLERELSPGTSGEFAEFLAPIIPQRVNLNLNASGPTVTRSLQRLNYLLYPKRLTSASFPATFSDDKPPLIAVLDPTVQLGHLIFFSNAPEEPATRLEPGHYLYSTLTVPAGLDQYSLGRIMIGVELSDPATLQALRHLRLTLTDTSHSEETTRFVATCSLDRFTQPRRSVPFDLTEGSSQGPLDPLTKRPMMTLHAGVTYAVHLKLADGDHPAVAVRKDAKEQLILRADGIPADYRLIAIDKNRSGGTVFINRKKLEEVVAKQNKNWLPLLNANPNLDGAGG